MLPILIVALVVGGLPTLYFAVRSREFRKVLAGAFFVSGGVQFYFYLANVSIPRVGTSQIQTPAVSGARSIVHFVLFLITLYLGFFSNPNGVNGNERLDAALPSWREISASLRDGGADLDENTMAGACDMRVGDPVCGTARVVGTGHPCRIPRRRGKSSRDVHQFLAVHR